MMSIFFGLSTASALMIGVYFAMSSDLFRLEVIDIAKTEVKTIHPPVDANALRGLVAIGDGSNLLRIDLDDVEKRLLSHPWIRSVRLEKKFPSTLRAKITFRETVAIWQDSSGGLSYVDSDGTIFDEVNLDLQADLPVLSVVKDDEDPERVKEFVQFVLAWQRSGAGKIAELSELRYDSEKGFDAMLTYRIGKKRAVVRSLLKLGQNIDDYLTLPQSTNLERLGRSLRYLRSREIPAKKLTVFERKKIVVKKYASS